MQRTFLRQAIQIALDSVRAGGGPFGALVVKDGAVLATGANRVTLANDPTAHAEILALREACRLLGVFQLDGCDVYCSCEPCPMCLGALYWARPSRVYYAATSEDAAAAGFDDSLIYRQIAVPHAQRSIPMLRMTDDQATRPFEEWVSRPDKTGY